MAWVSYPYRSSLKGSCHAGTLGIAHCHGHSVPCIGDMRTNWQKRSGVGQCCFPQPAPKHAPQNKMHICSCFQNDSSVIYTIPSSSQNLTFRPSVTPAACHDVIRVLRRGVAVNNQLSWRLGGFLRTTQINLCIWNALMGHSWCGCQIRARIAVMARRNKQDYYGALQGRR
jgi:hypothetical protein